jgi:C1A family cysteine protease
MYAIEEQGPVSASMECPGSFFDYGGGVYQTLPGERSGSGHAVTLVGWGTSATGVPYWVGQNSWGGTWCALSRPANRRCVDADYPLNLRWS